MKVTKEEVAYIAKLSNLMLTPEQAEKQADEFSNILNHFDTINQENLTGIEMYSFEDEPLRLRKDEAIPFKNSDELYANTKSMQETAIKIPKVVE
jgi:aspartyl-tRNA(Asn)/glutamyl-tRNA(Gln) amidotransferase subunit C